MNFEEAFKVIDGLVVAKAGRHLDQAEKIIIEAAWEDKDYKEIAQKSPYSVERLQRDVGRKLWILLTGVLGNGEKVTKKRLRSILERKLTAPALPTLSNVSLSTHWNTLPQVIGGQPPDVSNFYGRGPELAMLKELTVENRCVALIGGAGIGKSALAAKLMEVVRADLLFDRFVWRSIHYGPLLQDLVTDLLKILAPDLAGDLPDSTQAKVSLFVGLLQSRRCLLVLDAAEAVVQGNRNTSLNPYGDQYADYGVFLRRIVEEQHQSCLILTSREPFIDISYLQRKGQPARSMKVEGLGKDAMPILQQKLLTDEKKWGDLIQVYRGNPLALQMVASRIQEFFGGSVENFLNCRTTLMSDLFQETLDEQFGSEGRLTNLERQIMGYLAEELAKGPDSITFTKMLSDIKMKAKLLVSTSEIIEALAALNDRSLVERTKSNNGDVLLTLQPVIKKYVLTDPSGLVQAPFQNAESA